jgi:hypothetical protein
VQVFALNVMTPAGVMVMHESILTPLCNVNALQVYTPQPAGLLYRSENPVKTESAAPPNWVKVLEIVMALA